MSVERPILFSGPMVRALLDGTKTQTRRVIDWKRLHKQAGLPFPTKCRLAWFHLLQGWGIDAGDGVMREVSCPYGKPGDRLWVKETFCKTDMGFAYRATTDAEAERCRQELGYKWRPSIFCTRAASRITLEGVSVRVERLQDISEEDAKAEGVTPDYNPDDCPHNRRYIESYCVLWDSLNAARGHGWARNPWVWVVEFRRVQA